MSLHRCDTPKGGKPGCGGWGEGPDDRVVGHIVLD
jgi:hypothetical protein